MFWTKPNGTKIETNDSDETIAYCKSLGWKPAVKPKKTKRTSPSKE